MEAAKDLQPFRRGEVVPSHGGRVKPQESSQRSSTSTSRGFSRKARWPPPSISATVFTRLPFTRLPPEDKWTPEPAICVVLASGGYPGPFPAGRKITGLASVSDGVVFHAGTRQQGNDIVTAGGRVLGVTATGSTLQASMDRAYAAVGQIRFDGMHFRKDIGAKGLKRYNVTGSGT